MDIRTLTKELQANSGALEPKVREETMLSPHTFSLSLSLSLSVGAFTGLSRS